MSTDWRASLVPAAAVIPAPIAYIKVAAVKKLVVGSQSRSDGPSCDGTVRIGHLTAFVCMLLTECACRVVRLL